jgi:primase-polymerase (primpol)-like protein
VRNTAASSTNPDTWTDYTTALASDLGDGLGFVLNGDGIICIDLDHCFDGQPNALATKLMAELPETYIEISPSGHGLHIWGYANLEQGRRFDRNGLSVEVYPKGRYITVTGRAIKRAPLAKIDLTKVLPEAKS